MPRSNKITPEIVYQEAYNEMRRYRDYELSSSNWYILFLLAILGTVTTNDFSSIPNSWKIGLCLITIIIGFMSLASLRYVQVRHRQFRTIISDNLEPVWYQDKWANIKNPPIIKLKPIYFLYIILASLSSLNVFFILAYLQGNIMTPLIINISKLTINWDAITMLLTAIELIIIIWGLRAIKDEFKIRREDRSQRSYENLISVLDKLLNDAFWNEQNKIIKSRNDKWPGLPDDFDWHPIIHCLHKLNIVQKLVEDDVLDKDILFSASGQGLYSLGIALRNFEYELQKRKDDESPTIHFKHNYEPAFKLLASVQEWENDNTKRFVDASDEARSQKKSE